MGNDLKGALSFIGIAIILVGGLWISGDVFELDTEALTNAAEFVVALATVAAIIIGGAFAWRNLWWLRTFQPHITISHAVTHRRIGTQYLHIAVVATLHNSSRVKVEIEEGFIQLLKVSPIEDDDVLALYAETFVVDAEGEAANQTRYIPWPSLQTVRCATEADALVIEPGESHHETVEFIVSDDVNSVIAYSYFYNPNLSRSPDSATDWEATTPYDIIHRA